LAFKTIDTIRIMIRITFYSTIRITFGKTIATFGMTIRITVIYLAFVS
jgi:hypothetical protein